MKTWDQFFPDVLIHVPGCPDPTVERALLRAAQEFFETTRVWRLWSTEDIVTEADETEYEPFLETRVRIARIESATLDGRPIAVRSPDELPGGWQDNMTSVCTGVHTTDLKTIVLLPPPAADLALNIELSLTPSDSASGIDDVLFANYGRQIACGALAALKEQADKPYTDLAGSQVWRARFDSHMNVADFQRFRGFSSARPRRQIKTF